ncbi:hypothetical protein HDU91_001401, partial [Kappamyces sp. JEL0680]
KSCIDLHPNYEYRLWTDSDLRELVRTKASWLLKRYDGFENFINRVDVGRYLVLYLYGGFFIDLDVECLKSHERFVKMGGVLLPQMINWDANKDSLFPEHNIPNSWLASSPSHPFWLGLLRQINGSTDVGVENVTGSVFLYHNIFKRQKGNTVVRLDKHWNESDPLHTMLEPGLLFPFDWRIYDQLPKVYEICAAGSDRFSPQMCKQQWPSTAYAITYWTKTWGDWRMKDHILNQPNR